MSETNYANYSRNSEELCEIVLGAIDAIAANRDHGFLDYCLSYRYLPNVMWHEIPSIDKKLTFVVAADFSRLHEVHQDGTNFLPYLKNEHITWITERWKYYYREATRFEAADIVARALNNLKQTENQGHTQAFYGVG